MLIKKGLHFDCILFQLGVRTEGIQEALLKLPQAPVDADRITKIKHFIRAVGFCHHFNSRL